MALLDAAAQLARTCGARLSFDPSSTGVVERFGGRQLVRCCERLRVDVLLPNRPEALALAGVKRVDAAVTLLAEFVPTVVVKDGERGCLCSVDGKPVRVRTLPIVAADSTGAGDAFDAGVLVGLSEGNDLESASRRGNEAAHQVIQYFGGRPGLL